MRQQSELGRMRVDLKSKLAWHTHNNRKLVLVFWLVQQSEARQTDTTVSDLNEDTLHHITMWSEQFQSTHERQLEQLGWLSHYPKIALVVL